MTHARLAGAFFANRVEVVDDMLNVEGGVWASTTVPARIATFQCSCVVLCDTRRRDVGPHYTLHIDAARSTGQRWTPAWSTKFQLTSDEASGWQEATSDFDIPLDVTRRRTESVRQKRSLTTPRPLGFAGTNRS